ncbi:hypothetical protein SASPL_146517 [Salvia splendens]|uniref:Uncharacterized protein n=1 Tax=Salvia splendens TaxID=180675 RepID=A0A8X8WC98_SALSN|nr:hypothetical protein SASPL_146517 [Salvia splendens]
MTYQRLLLGLFVLLIPRDLFAQDLSRATCGSNGNYSSNSAYSANLDTTLSSLSTDIGNDGFYNASTGQGPDRVNAAALCRGDVQLDVCRECVQNGVSRLEGSCPVQKEAVFWDEFCTLRYSNATVYGTMESRPVYSLMNTQNVTNPDRFRSDLRTLLDDLRRRAAGGSSTRKVAAGNATGPDFQMIFGLVQCSPDLSSQDCTSCLVGAISGIPQCCDGKRGGRVLWPSCNLRFETVPFFNETRLQELEFVPPSPPLIEPPPQSPPSAVDDISTAESLQYSFSTIKAATNDFSDHNRLGQGGFGTVYKGKLPNSQEIAVKRLSRDSGQGDMEFKNEVLLLAKLQHRNLVRLLGFSLEGMEKLLVYEYVQNASLDNFIFVKHSDLDWDRRYKIIGGIARGILYLHEDSRLRIIHRDLKASNILLDREMSPKIADFGMARLFGQDQTQGNTSRVVGT